MLNFLGHSYTYSPTKSSALTNSKPLIVFPAKWYMLSYYQLRYSRGLLHVELLRGINTSSFRTISKVAAFISKSMLLLETKPPDIFLYNIGVYGALAGCFVLCTIWAFFSFLANLTKFFLRKIENYWLIAEFLERCTNVYFFFRSDIRLLPAHVSISHLTHASARPLRRHRHVKNNTKRKLLRQKTAHNVPNNITWKTCLLIFWILMTTSTSLASSHEQSADILSSCKCLTKGTFLPASLKCANCLNDGSCNDTLSCFTSEDDASLSRCFNAVSTGASSLMNFSSSRTDTAYIDNCANTCICKHESDLRDYKPFHRSCRKKVGNVGGASRPKGIGTWDCTWKDDTGQDHKFSFPNTRHFPDSPANIISVSQLGLLLNDGDDDTYIKSGTHSSLLVWNKAKFKRSIQHTASYMPLLIINDASSVFASFLGQFRNFYDSDPSFSFLTDADVVALQEKEESNFLFGTQVKYTDPDSHIHLGTILKRDGELGYNIKLDNGTEITAQSISLDLVSGKLDSPAPPEMVEHIMTHPDDSLPLHHANEALTKHQRELLHWHIRLGHLSFDTLIKFAKVGIIPRHLANIEKFPLCPSCIFGRAHKRPWRSNAPPGTIRHPKTDKPGSCVSVDQIVSGQLGLVPQGTGALTGERIKGATVFVDNCTSFRYVHLMRRLDGKETIEAKHAFERLANSHGVKIKGYRADNGRFADTSFKEDCLHQNQVLTFCGVGAHHQNGIAERAIRDLSEIARTSLLNGERMWPEMIGTILWPLALAHACDRHNKLTIDNMGYTPIERFSGVRMQINASEFHTWGCPVFVLNEKLQSGPGKAPKWDPRARLGLYLGFSPFHASSVALVLNPHTGHVSPQYHVVFYDDFSAKQSC